MQYPVFFKKTGNTGKIVIRVQDKEVYCYPEIFLNRENKDKMILRILQGACTGQTVLRFFFQRKGKICRKIS